MESEVGEQNASHWSGSDVVSRRDAIRFAAGLGAGLVLAPGCAVTAATGRGASEIAPPREFRGAWVATVDNIDWPSTPGLSVERQQREIERTLNQAQRLRLNAILLQVRPTADALYDSPYEPWSAFLSGAQGRGPGYDPLEIWVRGAHERGMDLHAWVNPFRAHHPKSVGPIHPTHVARARRDITRDYGPYKWLDPGEPDARALALRVVEDLLARYDLDGIHMDDYFYPYPRDGVEFPDDGPYGAYRARSGSLVRDDWRRENINTLIRELDALVAARGDGAIFTVSPFGIWRPDHPQGVKGFDAYAGLYADSRRWFAEGWCDAIMPQLYWPVDSSGQPFQPLLEWWASQNASRRHLWPGLYLTRIKPEGETPSWMPGEITRQIEITRRNPTADGVALFSMVGMLENRRGVSDALERGPFREPALVPETPWKPGPVPGAPRVRAWTAADGIHARCSAGPGPTPRNWVLQAEGRVVIAPGGRSDVHLRLPAGARPRRVIARAAGGNGRLGPSIDTPV